MGCWYKGNRDIPVPTGHLWEKTLAGIELQFSFVICDFYSHVEYSFSFQVSVQDELVQVQPDFKSNLLEAVEIFREDVTNFSESYEKVI